jgi:histidinol phosphatase-like PHP family hydrolase
MTPGADRLLGRQDLHCHTTMSDGHLSLAEVVETAAALGVQVGIADHVSTRNPGMMVASEEETRAYLDALERAPVFRSGEFCWCDDLWRTLPGEVMARFDYRIGSNHGFWLPDGSTASPWWETLPAPWDRQPRKLMDLMVDNLCDMVRTMPVQIAAHSTMIPPAFLELEDDVLAWWTPEREDRYVEALAESGVALEISNRYRLPHDRLLRKAKEAGVRFTLGSDGHHARQVARLEWAAEAARRAGIGDADLFVPERGANGRG